MSELLDLNLVEASKALKNKEISSLELPKAYLKSMIGYKTNVGSKTRFQFMKKIMRTVEEKVERLGSHNA